MTLNLPPTTTEQEDKISAGQRRINLIWEATQAIIAIMIVAAVVVAALAPTFTGRPTLVPDILSNALFLIVGFYFSRTNHSSIGGVGPKPPQDYTGR